LQQAVFKLNSITDEFSMRILAKEDQNNDICRNNAIITNIMIGRQVLDQVIILNIWVVKPIVRKAKT
jgi:hypothetical protein